MDSPPARWTATRASNAALRYFGRTVDPSSNGDPDILVRAVASKRKRMEESNDLDQRLWAPLLSPPRTPLPVPRSLPRALAPLSAAPAPALRPTVGTQDTLAVFLKPSSNVLIEFAHAEETPAAPDIEEIEMEPRPAPAPPAVEHENVFLLEEPEYDIAQLLDYDFRPAA